MPGKELSDVLAELHVDAHICRREELLQGLEQHRRKFSVKLHADLTRVVKSGTREAVRSAFRVAMRELAAAHDIDDRAAAYLIEKAAVGDRIDNVQVWAFEEDMEVCS